MEITADSTIYDLLKEKPDAAEVLFKFGMGCVGCAIARGETIREAAMVHGIPLDELLAALGIKET
jgi:hybrid cluster-associated redox disulfide protein